MTITTPLKQKAEALAAASGKQPPKTKAPKKRSTGNGSGPAQRLSNEWPSSRGKDVSIKDRVRTAEGIVIDVIGRWTKKTASGNVPMVTGNIVSLPAGATVAAGDTKRSDAKGRSKGDRQNAVAAEVTHAK